jgi:hypothetical protein
MAAVTSRISTASTTNAATYASGSFTPAASELLVVFVVCTGDSAGVGTLSDSQGLNWTRVTVANKNSSADKLYCFVANKKAANSSMTVTFATNNGSASGAVIQALGVSSMNRVGLGAVRQSSIANNVAAGTPAATFGAAALTGNPVFSFVANQTSPALTTGHPPTSFTQGTDTGYSTPTTGAIAAWIASGFTGTTVTWGTSSATSYGSIVLELDTTSPAAMSTLTDAFGGVVLDTTKWIDASFGGSQVEALGYLSLAPGTLNAGSGGEVDANAYYSLIGSYALVKITQIPVQNAEYSLILSLGTDGNNLIRITGYAVDGHFEAVKVVNGSYTQLATGTFNISTTNWWRIREASGTVFWEYSADGSSWSTLFSVAAPIDVSTLIPTLQCYDGSSDSAPGSVRFVNFNIVGGTNYTKSLNDSVTLTETLKRSTSKTLVASITLTETLKRATSKKISTSISLVETLKRATAKTINTSISLTEILKKQTNKTLVMSITLTQILFKRATGKTLATSVTLIETLSRHDVFARIIVDSVTLVETLQKKTSKLLATSVSLSETLSRIQGKLFTTSVTLTETLLRASAKRLTTSVSLTETLKRATTRLLVTSVSLTDSLKRSDSKTLSMSVTLTDKLIRNTGKTFVASINLVDKLIKNPAKMFKDSFTLIEFLLKRSAFYRTIVETISLSDRLARSVTKQFITSVTLSEVLQKNIRKLLTDHVTLGELLNQVAQLARKYAKSMTGYLFAKSNDETFIEAPETTTLETKRTATPITFKKSNTPLRMKRDHVE